MRISPRYAPRLTAAAVATLAALGAATSNAVPVNYDEAVDGPLATNPVFVTPADALALDVGTNVISGTATWSFSFGSTTFDTALLDLADGLEIVSITLSGTNVTGTGILSSVTATLLGYDATATSSSIIDSATSGVPFGATSLYTSQLPVDTAGFYGLCICGYGGSLASGQSVSFDYTWSVVVASVAVPEPATLTLLISGLLGMAVTRRRLAR